MDQLRVSKHLNRMIRQGPPGDLGRPTRDLLDERLAAGETQAAIHYLDYLFEEHFIIRDLNAVFCWHLVHYILDRCEDRSPRELIEESMAAWIVTTAGGPRGLACKAEILPGSVRLSDSGEAWEFFVTDLNTRYILSIGPMVKQRERWSQRRADAAAAIERADAEAMHRVVDLQLREELLVHDIYGDWAWSLLSIAARTWDEACLGDMLRATQDPWLTPRYAKAAVMISEEALQLAVEGMRGHFAGPGRRGEVSVVEEPTRYVMSFDACGSGGRMRRGDATFGSPSRLEPPYNFVNVEAAYPWTWNRKGVCAYCAHCAVALQIVPIEQLGYPMRVTEYPDDPEQPCRWIIYKRPDLIPAEAYTSVGKTPPTHGPPHV